MRKYLFGLVFIALVSAGVVTALSVQADSLTSDPEEGLSLNKDFRTARTDAQNSKQFFRDAKVNWEKARDAYLDDASEGNLETAKRYAIQLIKQTIDVYDKHYILLTARLNNSTGFADDERAALLNDLTVEQEWLQTQRVAIAETNDANTVTDISNALNAYAAAKSVFVKKTLGLIASSRIQKVITQMDDAVLRLDEDAAVLTNLEKETSTLTEPRANLIQGLAAVKEKYQRAHDGFAALSDIATADQDFESSLAVLREAGDELINAKISLDQIISEIKKIKASKVGGNGTLSTQGDGKYVISIKNGNTTIAADGSASLTVYDRAGDAAVETQGTTAEDSVGRVTVYTGFTQATITGTDILLVYNGSTTELIAKGTGRAYLEGTGTYQAIPDGVAEDLELGKGVVFNLTQ